MDAGVRPKSSQHSTHLEKRVDALHVHVDCLLHVLVAQQLVEEVFLRLHRRASKDHRANGILELGHHLPRGVLDGELRPVLGGEDVQCLNDEFLSHGHKQVV